MIDESKYLYMFAFAIECKCDFRATDYGTQKDENGNERLFSLNKKEFCFHYSNEKLLWSYCIINSVKENQLNSFFDTQTAKGKHIASS